MAVFAFPVTRYTENNNYFVFLFSVSRQDLRNLFLSSTSRTSLNILRWSQELQTWPTPFLAIMQQLACPGHVDFTWIEQKHIVIWKLNMKHLSHTQVKALNIRLWRNVQISTSVFTVHKPNKNAQNVGTNSLSLIRIAAVNKLYRLILRLQSASCLKMFQEGVGIHAV